MPVVLLIIIVAIILIIRRKKKKTKNDTDSHVSSKDNEPVTITNHSWFWSITHTKELKRVIDKLHQVNDDLDLKNQKLTASNEKLTSNNKSLKEKADVKLSLKQMKPIKLDQLIEEKQSTLSDIENELSTKQHEFKTLTQKVDNLNSQIIDLSDQLEYEGYGLYKPRYNFANSSTFKGKLSEVRAAQKSMIKNGDAGIIFQPMSFNGSDAKGRSMQKKNIKQLLRSFNGECEAAINKVTKSNIDMVERKINRSFEQLNKLNDPNGVRLTTEYLDSKLDEAHIALEYALKKEEEKQLLREQKEREREERKLQRQIATERAKYEKDETHFEQAKDLVKSKIEQATTSVETEALKKELAKLQEKLNAINEKKAKLTNRAENPTAGYVYIISNIGAFGHHVFKIGVTRRLDPMERIRELGSASVPFKFDVHALIFSDDAFKLEKELHDYFDRKRVNKVNRHKEFFKIDMNEIKQVLSRHKELTFDFNEIPEATEFRDSLLIEQKQNEEQPV